MKFITSAKEACLLSRDSVSLKAGAKRDGCETVSLKAGAKRDGCETVSLKQEPREMDVRQSL